MESTLSAWGQSVGLRIPKAALKALGLEAGTKVAISVRNATLVIEPVQPKKRYSVTDLLQGVSAANAGDEVDWGPRQDGELL